MKYIISVIFIILWLYILNVLKRCKLKFWTFITGCCGLFLILMILVRPWLTMPLARCVASIAGLVGNLTNTYMAYFKYGVLFIQTASGAVTLQIDLECSGIIEISVFLALIAFFEVYTVSERVLIGIIGTFYTILANALRITVICLVIRAFGTDMYYAAHTFIGRILFYILQVLLYFYVFTKPQIVHMRVGRFSYGKKTKSEAQ
jgi:exosortase family protein XrtG